MAKLATTTAPGNWELNLRNMSDEEIGAPLVALQEVADQVDLVG